MEHSSGLHELKLQNWRKDRYNFSIYLKVYARFLSRWQLNWTVFSQMVQVRLTGGNIHMYSTFTAIKLMSINHKQHYAHTFTASLFLHLDGHFKSSRLPMNNIFFTFKRSEISIASSCFLLFFFLIEGNYQIPFQLCRCKVAVICNQNYCSLISCSHL